MSRNESYVPLLKSYPDSEKINTVSEGAEAMFCRLLALSDDGGNYFGAKKRLLCKLYALRYENGTMNSRKVMSYRAELVKVGLVALYVVDDVEYLHILNCRKSLRKDVAPKYYFPEFVNGTAIRDGGVTDPAQPRNEPLTGRSRQSNPIQSNLNQSKPTKRRRNVTVTYTSQFESFWKIYPKRWIKSSDKYVKLGKHLASEQFEKLDIETQRTAYLAAVELGKGDKQYVKDAFRWLRDRGFDDYIPAKKKETSYG